MIGGLGWDDAINAWWITHWADRTTGPRLGRVLRRLEPRLGEVTIRAYAGQARTVDAAWRLRGLRPPRLTESQGPRTVRSGWIDWLIGPQTTSTREHDR